MHPLSWTALLVPAIPWIEKLIRPAFVYIFLLAAFRISSKRELAQATLFDFLTILLISNVVQNAMIGDDNSVLGAFAGTVALLVLSFALNRSTAKSHKLRIALEGAPSLLVHNGRVLTANQHKDHVSLNDLYTGLREQGISHLSEVRYALLELDGSISVIRSDSPERALNDPGTTLPPEVIDALLAEQPSDSAVAA